MQNNRPLSFYEMIQIEPIRSKELLRTEVRTGTAGQVLWWIGVGCVLAGKIWKKLEAESFREASGFIGGTYKVTKQMAADHAATRELYSLLLLVGAIFTSVGCALLLASYILKRKRVSECSTQTGKGI